ncbi:MAG: hypothetical protein IJ137_01480 [Eubacterium sp.]|nr:hypothetical protein [Eubacterium sp.]
MSNHITTYTGLYFEPTNPDGSKICIEDIAHALSMTCRGNGHVKSFWSVGEHCILCAKEAALRGYPDRLVLACLLHDASECYMSDLPRPFKLELPEYKKLETRLLAIIYEHFLGSALSEEEETLLKEIDDAFLWYDLTCLLNEKPEEDEPEVHIKPDYRVRPFEEVEREYLAMFRQYDLQVQRGAGS